MNETLYKSMTQSIIDGNVSQAAELAHQAVDRGIDPLDAVNNGYVVGIKHVGDEFSCGNAFIPELITAGAAMKAAMGVLEPEIAKHGTERDILGVVILGTVEGDVHDIGKNLVGTMLAAYGFEVHDMGVDVPIPRMVEKAREVDADIIAVSALLTTTMLRQQDVVTALEETGMRASVKVLVGGAPVTQSWVEEIGADGFSEDAIGAVALAKELLGKN